MEKALSSGADALILDLEDSVANTAKAVARREVAAFLATRDANVAHFVRVNPVGGDLIEADITAIAGSSPDGLMLPKACGRASIEALAGLCPGVPIIPVATETPDAMFELGSYRSVSSLLAGLTWGAEDLSAVLGASTAREDDGRFTPPYELARSLALFAAHAASLPAIETVYPAFRDITGLRAFARRASRDGFSGMMAIHPSQVLVINECFSPTEGELARAREIVEAFDAHPGVGVVQIGGAMIDAPHLKQARATIARAGEG
jgi:citrate lyase subunit beta/citryl-CoA lyase